MSRGNHSPLPRVFLHVGTHKTGTTSFQHILQSHQAAFDAAGVRARTERVVRPDGRLGKRGGNSRRLANLILRPELVTPLRQHSLRFNIPPEKVEGRLRAVKNRLDLSLAYDLLISSESLCLCRTEAELQRLHLLFPPTEVTLVPILVLRNIADWRASWANQLQKRRAKGHPGPPEDTPPENRTDGAWYFDPAAITRFWQRAGQLQIIDYDAALREAGSVIPALLEGLGVPQGTVPQDVFRNRRAVLDGPGEG